MYSISRVFLSRDGRNLILVEALMDENNKLLKAHVIHDKCFDIVELRDEPLLLVNILLAWTCLGEL